MEQLIHNIHFTNTFWTFFVPIIFMTLDIITGYYNAWKNSEVSSSKMRDGLGKKLAEICAIIVGVICKFAFGAEIVMVGLILYVCFMELLSLAENCDKLGLKLPTWLQNKLNNVENEINKKDK